MKKPESIALTELIALLTRVFVAHGCRDDVARVLSETCAQAEAMGSESHGVFRVEGYVSTLRSGWVDGQAVPEVRQPKPGHVHVAAKNGFAQPALAAARAPFVAAVRANGIAVLTIGDSHHLASLWPDVTPFAEDGLIAMSFVNSFACGVPVGASAPILGTNPFAFAAPIPGQAPLVFDFATTSMSNGDVQIAAREGKVLPEGRGVDRNGLPTTDPKAILDGGALLPFGGHKGSALSLMIELLVPALTGGLFSSQVDWSNHPGAATPHTGQVVIGIDPSGGVYDRQARAFAEMLRRAGMEHYPGRRRWLIRNRDTVVMTSDRIARLEVLALGAA